MDWRDVFGFLLRVIAFAATFWFMCEYLISCRMQTYIGVLVLLIIMGAITVFYAVYQHYNLQYCHVCQRSFFKATDF